MKKIDKYSIKTEWSEVKIIDYVQMQDIQQSKLDEIDKMAGTIAILSDLEMNDVLTMDLNIFNQLANSTTFVHTLPSSKLKTHYTFNNIDFVVKYDMTKLSAQQYIDMLHLQKEDILKNIHKIMSLFMIPAKEKKTILGKKYVSEIYGSYDNTEVADILLNHCTIDVAYEIMLFFSALQNSLIDRTRLYLVKQIKKLMKSKENKKVMSTQKDGDGLQLWMKLLNELEDPGTRSSI